MLVMHIPGPTSWEYLRTVNGVVYPTFAEAAKERGLIANSTYWVQTILEAISRMTSFRRRINWTAILFAHNSIIDAADVLRQVVEESRAFLTPRRMRSRCTDDIINYLLRRFEYIFRLQSLDPGSFESCCQRLGLGHPDGLAFDDEDLIDVIAFFRL